MCDSQFFKCKRIVQGLVASRLLATLKSVVKRDRLTLAKDRSHKCPLAIFSAYSFRYCRLCSSYVGGSQETSRWMQPSEPHQPSLVGRHVLCTGARMHWWENIGKILHGWRGGGERAGSTGYWYFCDNRIFKWDKSDFVDLKNKLKLQWFEDNFEEEWSLTSTVICHFLMCEFNALFVLLKK